MKNRSAIVFLLFVITGGSLPVLAQDWVYKGEKKGVKVYHRSTGGVHELKLATTLNTSLTAMVLLFADVEGYAAWGYKIAESRLLNRVSDHELYYYSKVDFPWPMSDRDLIMRSTVSQDYRTKVVKAISMAHPKYLPVVKDVVRMEKAITQWTLTPVSAGVVGVEYYINSDPGGNLPAWMVNMALDVGPIETIERMRKTLQEPKYRDGKLGFIRD